MSQIVKFGTNSLGNLENFLKEKKPKSIFLVTGKKSYLKCGAKIKLEPILKNYKQIRFFDFEENPKIEDVEKGVNFFIQNQCDLIIAIGGGSVIDMAKLINYFNKKNKPFSVHSKHVTRKDDVYPLIAIPTTAGTGSEATHFAVVYENNLKYSIADDLILPEYVILDPQFAFSTPKNLTAYAGVDALCQAIESIWARGSNSESKIYAEKALQLVWDNIEQAVVSNNYSAKENLLNGAFWAGKAINISKTTACHALSYKMTSLFNIPHGQAVVITLTSMIKLNFNNSKSEILRIFKILNVKNLEECILKIEELLLKIGICLKLNQLGINKSDLSELTDCNIERLKNNPTFLNKKDIENLFENIY